MEVTELLKRYRIDISTTVPREQLSWRQSVLFGALLVGEISSKLASRLSHDTSIGLNFVAYKPGLHSMGVSRPRPAART